MQTTNRRKQIKEQRTGRAKGLFEGDLDQSRSMNRGQTVD